MPHQIPMNFEEWIHEGSLMAQGSLRLRISVDSTRPPADSASWTVRHGERIGGRPRTLTSEPNQGANSALRERLAAGSGLLSFIPAQSTSAASWRLTWVPEAVRKVATVCMPWSAASLSRVWL